MACVATEAGCDETHLSRATTATAGGGRDGCVARGAREGKKMTIERLRSAFLVALLLLAFALAGTMDYHDRVQDLSGHSLEQQ